MHTEVYRARPDVGSVIHGHPVYGTALGATDGQLQLLTHDAVLFADGIGEYDDGPALIMNRDQGQRVAMALGSRRAALLRNHGVVIAGEDVRWAVLAAVTLERAIRFQAIAGTLGRPRPIPQEGAERLGPQKYQDEFLDEYWAAWVRRVHGRRARERAVVG
jgi:L-fuculose-phosphate aldolase